MRDCIAHQYGCSCEEGQCKSKAIPLGTVKKANDMAGVFNVPVAEQLIRLVLVGSFIAFGAGAYSAHEHSKREAILNQEVTR